MPPLASEARRQLENVCTEARELAEAASRSALQKRAVDAAEPFAHFTAQDRELRTRLRARGRQVGDARRANKTQSIDQLTQELAYEYWHQMLFARFLAENNLLMHPDGVPVSLADCDELAKDEGAPNGFVLAARYASRMLPQIFRIDDVLLEVEFPVNDRLPLEKLLASLPPSTFTADDSLGWVYQFWQSKKKKEVNDSGEKIDGRTLPAVTQLFTEHYMVQFLLHNTIGAWWCARHNIQGPPGGAGVPPGNAPVEMEYLRWRDDGTPAAGKFEDWPKTLKDFTALDPCCGSGHFLVSAFHLLVPLRMLDEGLSARDACDSVLQENLFGLELDPRCTQIAAFALALAAWKHPSEDGQPIGYRLLPRLSIACSGQGVIGKKEEWLALANGDARLREGMDKLYDLFSQAPHLGSLLDPRREVGDIFVAGFAELQPLLEAALERERGKHNADAQAVGVAAEGITRAAELLAKQYDLIATNVPYRRRQDHAEALRSYAETWHNDAKGDLATIFFDRCHKLCRRGGAIGIVMPQNWLFLDTYEDLRRRHLKKQTWCLFSKLGPRAFETISGERVEICLLITENISPNEQHVLPGVHAITLKTPSEKAAAIRTSALEPVSQKMLLSNPGAIVTTEDISGNTLAPTYAECFQGTSTGDSFHYIRFFWELASLGKTWRFCQIPPQGTADYAGRECVIRSVVFTDTIPGSAVRGRSAWGKKGVAIGQMSGLPATLYTGEVFIDSTPVIIPTKKEYLQAVWHFCKSPDFCAAIRRLNPKLSVNNGYVNKVAFDLNQWMAIAEDAGDIPEPHSLDPTQWLFKGSIPDSKEPLQVAVARLLGYRWPLQSAPDHLDALIDPEGIICIPAVRGKLPLWERLMELLRASYGGNVPLEKLIASADGKPGLSLDDWLRDKFFEHHCDTFHQRPFIWHISDGADKGFSCLVNYHKLNYKALEKLSSSKRAG
jgi:hypothetical protein